MAKKDLTTNRYTKTGSKSGNVTLPEAIFNANINPKLMSLAVKVYLSNQRQGTSKTKRRSQVVASTRKIWRQKGTGRARHGAISAPIFVGGGVAHGPTGEQNHQQKLTKKMRQAALKSALTQRAQQSKVAIVNDLKELDVKTKDAATLIEKIDSQSQKVLLILNKPYRKTLKATSNLTHVTCTQASRLNIYEVLGHQTIIIDEPALQTLINRFTVNESATKSVKSTKKTSASKSSKPKKTEEVESSKKTKKKSTKKTKKTNSKSKSKSTKKKTAKKSSNVKSKKTKTKKTKSKSKKS